MPLNSSPAAETNTMGATAVLRGVLSMAGYTAQERDVPSHEVCRQSRACHSACTRVTCSHATVSPTRHVVPWSYLIRGAIARPDDRQPPRLHRDAGGDPPRPHGIAAAP